MIIYKYKLNPTGITKLELLQGFRFMDVQTQQDAICIWVLQPESGNKIRVALEVRQTGFSYIPGDAGETYLGSFQTDRGLYVGHVFHLHKGLPF
jgi:hypothetical protein